MKGSRTLLCITWPNALCVMKVSDRWRTESKHLLGNVDMCQRMYIQLYTCNSIDRLLKDMQNASFPASHQSPLNHLCLCGSHWFRQSLIPRNEKRQRHSHLHHLVPDEQKATLIQNPRLLTWTHIYHQVEFVRWFIPTSSHLPPTLALGPEQSHTTHHTQKIL